MEILRKYGEATTILFPLVDAGAADFEATPVTFATGDTQISKDEAAFANATNNPAHEGRGIYSLALTAAEMQAARIVITIIDSATKAWEDQALVISTYGNASAQHAFDLDAATQNVNVTQISGDSAAADNAEAFFDNTGFVASNSTVGTVTTLTGHTAQTGDSFARLGAPAGASVSADIAAIDANVDAVLVDTGTDIPASLSAIETDTQDIQTQIGAAGAGLSAVPWNSAWDAEVQSEVQDAIVANHLDHLFAADYDPASKPGTATALLNELIESDAGVSRFTSNALEQAPGGSSALPSLLQNTTIAALASQTSFTLTAGSSDDDAYNNQVIVVTDQSTATQKAVGIIDDYVGSTKTITLANALAFTIAVGDEVDIIATSPAVSAPTAAAIRAEIDANSTQLAAIVADTNELQTDWANGGRLDAILDARASQTSVNTIDGIVDDILVDTGTTLPNNIAGVTADIAAIESKIDTIGANVDGVVVDTGTLIPATLNEMKGATFDAATDSLEAIRNKQTDIETDTQALQAGQASLATSAALATVDANVDAILEDTGTTLPASLSAISGKVDTVDTVVDANAAAIAALNDISVDDILTTQMSESYAADGVAPTLAQALLLIQQMLGDFSISGTTLTVKRLDGSTTAATFTLNDATDPTGATRSG